MKENIKRLLTFTRFSRLSFLVALVSAALGSVFTLVAPLVVGQAIDRMIKGIVDFNGLIGDVKLLLAMYLLAAFFQWTLAQASNHIGYRTAQALRQQGYQKLHSLPVKAIDTHPHGDYTARIIHDADAVSVGLIQGLPRFMTGATTIIGTLICMLSINVWAALAVLLLTPLSILVARRITLASHTLYVKQADAQGSLTAYVSERVHNRDLITAFSAEESNVDGFDEYNARLEKDGYQAQLYGALVNPVTRFVNHSVYVAVGLVGGLLALSGAISVGQISALLSYANQYTKPFNEISSVINQIQVANAALTRIFLLLDMPDERPEPLDAQVPAHVLGDVVFQDVSFRYVQERPLIQDFSLAVKPGQKIAIVGPTGAGKTTLVNLLMRFYDANTGDIRLDGTSIYRMTRAALRRNFAMVLQESWLFTGTVRENIAFGNPAATEEEIIDAARRAHADGFIARLPQGYDTFLSEHSTLSEGQTQLLCIARVLLSDPPLLILDEATSSVDTRTEMLVTRAFDRMMMNRTSFVIAHRLSTIRSADIILVMRDGQIVEKGTHKTLLDKQGFYYTMYMSQFEQTIDI